MYEAFNWKKCQQKSSLLIPACYGTFGGLAGDENTSNVLSIMIQSGGTDIVEFSETIAGFRGLSSTISSLLSDCTIREVESLS